MAMLNVTARLRARDCAEPPPFRGVVMDMDGLALDTEATYRQAWRAAGAELGFELSDTFCRGLFGRHADDVRSALASACGDTFDSERFHAVAEACWHAALNANGVEKMPGLDRLLGLLQELGLPYALATNSDAPYASEVLRRAGAADLFPVVVTRDEVAQGKPAPDLFREAARRLGVAASDCLGLEDSLVGLQACRSAGLVPVFIPSGAAVASAGLEDVWVLPNLDALADCIERVAFSV